MLYSEVKVENGHLITTVTKEVDQATLTSECWIIQIKGASACAACEYKNKPRLCGGMKIRERLGVPAPITRKRK